jgi:hypothetical protein
VIPVPLTTAVVGALLAAAVAGGAAGWLAYGLGQDAEIARRSESEARVLAAVARTQGIAAGAIAKAKVFHAPIRERIEHEVRTETVYRDCVATPGVLRDVNAALTGEPVPAGDGLVPPADANGSGAVR